MIRIPETRENEAQEISEEIIVENIPKFIKDIKSQIQESQRTPNKVNVHPPLPPKNPHPETHHTQTAEKQR